MEGKKSFMDLGASTSKTQLKISPRKNNPEGVTMMENPNLTILNSFLQTCMKFLRDQKVVEGLKEIINNYDGKEKPQFEQCGVNKVHKNKKRNDREM